MRNFSVTADDDFDMLFHRIVIDSHDVWSCLEECDIFGAAKIIVQAKIFLETHNTSRVMRNDDVLTFPLPFCRFFSASALSEVGLSSDSRGIKNLSIALAGCSSAMFLSQVSEFPSIWCFYTFHFLSWIDHTAEYTECNVQSRRRTNECMLDSF